jgi:MFS transporter, DHA1 family, inner membrane transport protein
LNDVVKSLQVSVALGNWDRRVPLTRWIDKLGAACCVTWALGLMALSLLLWGLPSTALGMALVIVPWALGCFSSNSAQQARLSAASPAVAPALLALNTSAMYVGQALGAAGGGALVAAHGLGHLHWAGMAWMLLAIGLSWALARRMQHTQTAVHA